MATRQELRGADHRRRGRTTASRRSGTAARSLRPRRHRPDPDRHARPGEAVQPLPQFYSRVGFAHQYRPLGQDELLFVLERHWRSLGKTLDPDDFTDAQAIAAIARITRGNFRLLERLFPQIQRVLKINELDTITNDVIEAAQSTLVIGVT